MNIYTKKQSFFWSRPKENRIVSSVSVRKILTGVVILITLIGFLNIFEQQVRNSFYSVSYPFTKIFWRSSNDIYVFFETFLNFSNIRKENVNLKEANQRLLLEISLIKDYLRQDQLLNEFSKNTQADNFKTVLASVSGLDALNDFILIDKGSADGISENMPVVSTKKILYGKIFKVYKNFSKVILISNKISVVNVKIQNNYPNQPPIYGAIKGQGNLSLYLDLVPSEAQINQGDVLVTSALEGIFPKDLLVGEITSNNRNDLKPFQTAQAKPFFSVRDTDNLIVITNYLR